MIERHLQICSKVSKFSDHRQHKIGALVAKGKKILSTGFNKMKTHPLSPHPFRSCHAEFMAIKYLTPEELEGATIYVYRENKDGVLSMSRPCPSCFSLIKNSGIKEIVYTKDGQIIKEAV